MNDLLVYLLVAGVLLAGTAALVMRATIRSQDAVIRDLSSGQTLLAEVVMEIRDTWDNFPLRPAMQPHWAALSLDMAHSLPRLLDRARRARVNLFDYEFSAEDFHAAGVGVQHRELDKLVQDIDDPEVTARWKKHRLIDFVIILRLALYKGFRPGNGTGPLASE